MAKAHMDTTKKLAEEMDKLAFAMVEQANKIKDKDKMDLKLDVLKTVTGYMSMKNRTPEEAEGADILDFRRRLARPSAGGGGDTGDGPEGGTDETSDDAGGDGDDTGDGGDEQPPADRAA